MSWASSATSASLRALAFFFFLAHSEEPCAFSIIGEFQHLVGIWHLDTVVQHNSYPVFYRADDPLTIYQWGGVSWDICGRDSTTVSSTCHGGQRSGTSGDDGNQHPLEGCIYTWTDCKVWLVGCPTSTTTSSISTTTQTETTITSTRTSTSTTTETVSSTTSSSGTTTSSSGTSSTTSTTTPTSTTSSSSTTSLTSSSSSTSSTSITTTSSSSTTSLSSSSTSSSTSTSSTSSTTTTTTTASSTSSSTTSVTTSSTTTSPTTTTTTSTTSTSSTFSSSTTATSSSSTSSSTTSSTTSSTSRTSTSSTSSTTTRTSSSTSTTTVTSTTATPTTTTSTTTTSTTTTSTTTTSITTTSVTNTTQTTTTSSSATSTGTTVTITTETRTTTTTLEPPSAEEQVAVLLKAIQEVEDNLLLEVLDSNESLSTRVGPRSTTSVAKLGDLSRGNRSDAVVVPVTGTNVRVTVPVTAFSSLVGPGETAVLLVTVFNASSDLGTGGARGVVSIELAAFGGGGKRKVGVAGLEEAIEFSLPANFTAGTACAFWDEQQGVWSQKGLSVNEAASLGGQLHCRTTHLSLFGAIWEGFKATFECSQISLLSGDGVAGLLNEHWLVLRGTIAFWTTSAVCLFAFLTAALFDYQTKNIRWPREHFLIPTDHLEQIDRLAKTQGEGVEQPRLSNRGAMLLPARLEGPPPEEGSESPPQTTFGIAASYAGLSASVGNFRQVQSNRSGATVASKTSEKVLTFCARVCAAWLAIVGFVKTIGGSAALREALDDILSTWWAHAGELRSFMEEMWNGLDCASMGGISTARFLAHCHGSLKSLMSLSARRLAGAALLLDNRSVNFVLENEKLLDLLIAAHEREATTKAGNSHVLRKNLTVQLNIDKGARKLQKKKSVHEEMHTWDLSSRDLAWEALHDQVGAEVRNQLMRHSKDSLFCISMHLFLLNHPLSTLFVRDIFTTRKMRSFVFLVGFFTSVAMTCVFFEVAGTKRQKTTVQNNCGNEELQDEIGYKIGRFMAIAMGSACLSSLPVVFLESLQTTGFKKLPSQGCPEWNRQLRAWRIQDRIVYVTGSLMLASSLFFINVFLANVSDEDNEDWFIAFMALLLQDFVVMPASIALLLPLLCGGFFKILGKYADIDRTRACREAHIQLLRTTNMMMPQMHV